MADNGYSKLPVPSSRCLGVFWPVIIESFKVNGYISHMIIRKSNTILQSKYDRPFLADAFYKNDARKKPVVIFSHGYRGFKDWGPFNLIAEQFAEGGLVFVKFNFSHNGTFRTTVLPLSTRLILLTWRLSAMIILPKSWTI